MNKYLELTSLLSGNPNIIKSFYTLMFDQSYHIDVNGYVVVTMMPPDLSGYGISPEAALNALTKDFIFYGVEVTPPELTMNIVEGSGFVPHASARKYTNSMSISYIDTNKLRIYSMHKDWVDYIHDVLLGNVDPAGRYIDEKELDYVGSAYIVRFEKDASNIVYVGKAIGIFPTNLPVKELIGSRTNNQVTLCNVNYSVAYYTEEVVSGGGGKLYGEFMGKIGGLYG